MKYIIPFLAILQLTLFVDLSAQSDKDESCRLTMVIPDSFTRAGASEGEVKYKSKRGRTTLTMYKAFKDAQNGYMNAQTAADHAYQELKKEGLASEMSVVSEKIGKTSFTIVAWVIPSLKKGFEPYMVAFNDECEILYQFKMSSTTSSKKELDKAFRSFLRSCKRGKSN